MEKLEEKGELKKVTIYPLKKGKDKRVTTLVRIEIHDLDFLKYYAKENKITLSKMLNKILFSYEINNI